MSTSVLAERASDEKAENARMTSFVGAIAIGDLVKSTLGPKGMDKILQSSKDPTSIIITNDGATILKNIALDNAAAKVLVNVSKVQDEQVGDGTTSVAVLSSELLREAEKLVEQHNIHPQVIIQGYREASDAAKDALLASSVDHSKAQPEAFKQTLLSIARTTLSSKVLAQDKEHFASLAVDAVLRLKGSSSLEHIHYLKVVGGKLGDSYLDDGFILDKTPGVNQPKVMKNAKILLANTAMDHDKIKVFGARVKVESPEELAAMERFERDKMKAKVDLIKAHSINVFINRQLIYNLPEQLFADAGIMAIEHADFEGIERLALVTGGQIASTFDNPELVTLGKAEKVEEVLIGDKRMTKFTGVASGEACTVVLRGATTQLLDEAQRSLHDVFCVLTQTVINPRVILGGGASELSMAHAVDSLALHYNSSSNASSGSISNAKRILAIEAYARALRSLPTAIADNGGLDSGELVSQLRALHAQGCRTMGLDMVNGTVGCMQTIGVHEPIKLKMSMLMAATDAAEQILRVDHIIQAAPRERRRH